MSDIQFNETPGINRPVMRKKEGGLEKMLIEKGIAKDKKQAEMILIGVAVLAFALTAMVLMTQMSPSAPSGTDAVYEDVPMQEAE